MVTVYNVRASLRRFTPAQSLVAVCVAVFVALRLVAAGHNISGSEGSVDSLLQKLMLPAAASEALRQPWSVVTYMLVHYDVLHLMMNMLWLYMFASIAQNICRRQSTVYLLFAAGGIAGAAAFLLVGSTVSAVHGRALTGASASILAIMAFAMARVPHMKLRLVFFGDASLKIIGIIALLLVVIGTGTGADSYGLHAAHAAGFLAGIAIAYALRPSRSAKPLISKSAPATARTPQQRPDAGTVAGSHPAERKPQPTPALPDDELLDVLLDKIRRSGYGSLSADERNTLFTISSKLRKHQ